jgi:xylulose-5-phosphate/fructose-6-phosphate phosphoketolase
LTCFSLRKFIKLHQYREKLVLATTSATFSSALEDDFRTLIVSGEALPELEATGKVFMEPTLPTGEGLSKDGRAMEVLSEHICQLEGYLLTGRHGRFSCYEAFIHIVDSMFNQHAKWLKVRRQIRGAGRSPR